MSGVEKPKERRAARPLKGDGFPGDLRCGIAGSEWVLFENSSHMAHVEERERYMQTIRSFIERVEAHL